MKHDTDDAHRATRLLRWYPPAWRERYGEEFADHLEQEFADRPVDRRRSINVAYKGLVARVGDFGFSNPALGAGGLSRVAFGTTFALLAVTSVLTLNFWSMAMLRWSSRTFHPVPIDVTTGILTAAAGLLVLVLLAAVLIVVGSAIRQFARGRGRAILVPSILALGSAAFIYYPVRWLPTMFAAVSHLRPSGFRWIHPGPAAYGLAEITRFVTQPWVSMWNTGTSGLSTSQTVLNVLTPLAVLVFAVAMALLVRRVELPRLSDRLCSATVVLLGVLSGVFVATTVVWFTVGGPSDYPTFGFMGNIAGVVYLVFLALVTVLVARLGLLARRNAPRLERNHIEILG